jgi:hypothetical protein
VVIDHFVVFVGAAFVRQEQYVHQVGDVRVGVNATVVAFLWLLGASMDCSRKSASTATIWIVKKKKQASRRPP